MNIRKQAGFTLIEMVTVIVILGIVGIGLSSFLGNAMLLFSGNVERDQLLSESRFAMTRMQEEMRKAVPNSFRVAGNSSTHCVEFAPTLWQINYFSIPQGSTSSRRVEMFFPHDPDGNIWVIAAGQYLTVNPQQAADVYDEGRNRRARIESCSDGGDGNCATRDDPDDVIQVNVNRAFASSSGARRGYLLNRTVSYCVSNGSLWRKEGGLDVNQNVSLSGATVVAEHVTNPLSSNPVTDYQSTNPFAVFSGVYPAGNFVKINLYFNSYDEVVNHHEEVGSVFTL